MILFDINEEMVAAWRKYFKNEDNIQIRQCSVNDIYNEYDCNIAIVTAGNSYGIMTGGIDLAVRKLYGYDIQDEIQDIILAHGPIAVGESVKIHRHIGYPDLIYAPTMITPQEITSDDVFYVFLKLLRKYGDNIAICGLGTGCGRIPYNECAEAMAKAYEYWLERREN